MLGLFVARKNVIGPFPRGKEVEVTEFLLQLDRLIKHALQNVIVTHFNKPGNREILAQRVAFETVIGEDAAKVRMALKRNAYMSQASR